MVWNSSPFVLLVLLAACIQLAATQQDAGSRMHPFGHKESLKTCFERAGVHAVTGGRARLQQLCMMGLGQPYILMLSLISYHQNAAPKLIGHRLGRPGPINYPRSLADTTLLLHLQLSKWLNCSL